MAKTPYPKRRFFIFFTISLLISCVLILIFLKDIPLIRGFIGDFLVVMFLYSSFKMIRDFKPGALGLGILAFSFIIEGLQGFHLNRTFGLEKNDLWNIVLGSTFDVLDLLAYTLGTGTAILLDRFFLKTK